MDLIPILYGRPISAVKSAGVPRQFTTPIPLGKGSFAPVLLVSGSQDRRMWILGGHDPTVTSFRRCICNFGIVYARGAKIID